MPAENCPSANFFNNSFTLTVSYDNFRTKTYCPENHDFILTINYTKSCPAYVKTNGGWKEATSYVYNGGWKEVKEIYRYNGSRWVKI